MTVSYPIDTPPEQPVIVVAVTVPQPAQRFRWEERQSGRMRRWIDWLVALLAAGFFLMAMETSSGFSPLPVTFTAIAAVWLAAVCFVGAWWGARRVRQKTRQRQLTAEVADTARFAAGMRVTFYSDRVEWCDLREHVCRYWQEIEDCLETPDGFILTDGKRSLILPGADLIDYDVRLIRVFLRDHLPSRYRVKTPAIALRQAPLPLMHFDEVPTAPRVEVVPEESPADRKERRLTAWQCAAFLQLFGVMLALNTELTPWLLADIGIFAVAAVAVGIGGTLVLWRWLSRRQARVCSLQWEPQGLRLTDTNGDERFVAASCVRQTVGDGWLAVSLATGEQWNVALPDGWDALITKGVCDNG